MTFKLYETSNDDISRFWALVLLSFLLNNNATHVRHKSTGTSTRGPMVAASAWSELTPNTAMAIAIASSCVWCCQMWHVEGMDRTDEIVATRCECLGNCYFIPEYLRLLLPGFPFRQIIHGSKGRSPHYDEIKDHGYENPEHWSQVVDNMVSLICRQDKDSIKQTEQW